MVTLALLNDKDEQIAFHATEDSPLPVGSNSDTAPEGFVRRREVTLPFEKCHKVRFYIYLLPNSLPTTTTLAGTKTTFPIQIKVCDKERVYLSEKWDVNRFGGCGREVFVTFD